MAVPSISPEASKTGVASAVIAATAEAAKAGTIEVDVSLYSMIAVCIALIGVYLARLVTIDSENKMLGRPQTLRETGPLTWIAILIVGPLIWHFQIPVPWAAIVGLGVGYSVRLILTMLGRGALGATRAIVREAWEVLDDEKPRKARAVIQSDPDWIPEIVDQPLPPRQDQLLNKIDDE